MENTSALLSDLQLRRWIRSGEPLAKSDGDGLTLTVSAAGGQGSVNGIGQET